VYLIDKGNGEKTLVQCNETAMRGKYPAIHGRKILESSCILFFNRMFELSERMLIE
jgi:hypothetical protein